MMTQIPKVDLKAGKTHRACRCTNWHVVCEKAGQGGRRVAARLTRSTRVEVPFGANRKRKRFNAKENTE
jgi:hypothetical protein